MTRFNIDNTEGYSGDEIAELNAEFDRQVASLIDDHWNDDEPDKSMLDHLAERLLVQFDRSRA